jgi:hypothetical protein
MMNSGAIIVDTARVTVRSVECALPIVIAQEE